VTRTSFISALPRATEATTMTLHSLMTQFSALPYSDVGCGPKHPSNPRTEFKELLLEYLGYYPHLSRYSEYTEFLESYAGASIGSDRDKEFMVFLILGIERFDDPCAQLLRPDGYHIFGVFRATQDSQDVEYVFAFNTNVKDDFAVYRMVTLEGPFELYEDSFLHWLSEVVQRGGRMT
jgi:hypothetical protein